VHYKCKVNNKYKSKQEMSETKKLNVGDKFAHATVGNVADFSGKAFLKEVLGLTGAEVSLGTLDPGQAVPFFHAHKGNEEVYIFLSGEGTFQVDGDTFPIASGSVVRVSTLKSLEQDKLVTRTIYATIPPKVEYRISEDGRTLLPILQELSQWGLMKMAKE
jgi:mannose-6-phosphate isomerase-like protein (cupin superfamily)